MGIVSEQPITQERKSPELSSKPAPSTSTFNKMNPLYEHLEWFELDKLFDKS